MVEVFKTIATLSASILDAIINLKRTINIGLIKFIIIIITLPIYINCTIIFFISVCVADLIKSSFTSKGFYPEDEGLQTIDYYLNYGEIN